jgi:hypothetical protein
MLDDDVTPADSARNGCVKRRALRIFPVSQLGNDEVCLETGLSNLTHDRTAVDGEVSKVGEQLLGTVLTLDKLEEIRGIVNELKYGAVSIEEMW